MKKTTLFALLAFVFSTSTALAGIFGVKTNQSGKVDLVHFNADLSVNTVATIEINGSLVANSFFQSADDGTAGFVTVNSFNNAKEIVVINMSGEIQNRFPINFRSMGFTYLPDIDGMGFIQSNQNHNPYGNNDDDISFVIFDLEQGFVRSSITLDQFAFDPAELPFTGKNGSPNGQAQHTEVTVSAPFYNSEKGRVEFFGTDVMGNQRHMMIDVLRSAVISDRVVYNNIVAAAPVDSRIYKVVTAEKESGRTQIFVADYNVQNGLLLNKVHVETHNNTTLNPGVLVMDESKLSLYYQGITGSSTRMIHLDPETNEADESTVVAGKTTFNFPVSKETLFDKLGSVSVYPNPTSNEVTVTNDYGIISRIEVLNIFGQVALVIEASSGLEVNTMKANLSDLAPGTYFIRSFIGEEVYVSKIGVQ
jgi:hypothetical protein